MVRLKVFSLVFQLFFKFFWGLWRLNFFLLIWVLFFWDYKIKKCNSICFYAVFAVLVVTRKPIMISLCMFSTHFAYISSYNDLPVRYIRFYEKCNISAEKL